jgi:SEC-C motif-containing protein
MVTNCPCGRSKAYEECCGLVHADFHKAITAEDLMRSRYSAFTKANGDYLMKSHHSTTRPIKEKEAIVAWAKSVTWVKLEVLATGLGLEADLEGVVEFKAHFTEDDQAGVIHETSFFNRENGHWVYVKGV